MQECSEIMLWIKLRHADSLATYITYSLENIASLPSPSVSSVLSYGYFFILWSMSRFYY